MAQYYATYFKYKKATVFFIYNNQKLEKNEYQICWTLFNFRITDIENNNSIKLAQQTIIKIMEIAHLGKFKILTVQ